MEIIKLYYKQLIIDIIEKLILVLINLEIISKCTSIKCLVCQINSKYIYINNHPFNSIDFNINNSVNHFNN